MTDDPSQPLQRRRFSRIQFPADVTIEIDGQNLPAQLVDISLHGALIEISHASAQIDSHCRLTLVLTEEIKIIMKLKVAHTVGNKLGCECTEIDLDSLTHLKRLVAYNLGDQDLLDRQLGELIHSDQG